MIRATWNGALVAESDDTIVVEGNHHFPPDAVDRRYLRESDTPSRCPWKGTASYYTLVVGDQKNPDAAWYYPAPETSARNITGSIAFWRASKSNRPETARHPASTTGRPRRRA